MTPTLNIDQYFTAEDYTNLGSHMALTLGSLEKGAVLLEAARRKDPHRADTLSLLGGCFGKMKRHDEACAALKLAINLDPTLRGAWYNLGVSLMALDKYSAARECFDTALTCTKNAWELPFWSDGEIHSAYGTLCQYSGEWQKQEDCFRAALTHNPESHKFRSNLGLNQMLQGDWHSGLPNFESRIYVSFPGWPLDPKKTPVLDAKEGFSYGNLDSSRVLVVAEQGAGDVIQFARYGETLKSLLHDWDCRVSLFCSNELAPLMRLYPGWDSVYCPNDKHGPEEDWDYQIALASIPLLLRGLKPRENAPFLVPPPLAMDRRSRPEFVATGLASSRRIGFCWRGNPDHPNDRFRSMPFDRIAPLVKLSNFTSLSLQKEDVAYLLPVPMPMDTWTDTATSICSLDLVVTVDTAIAHLAGTLGVETWVMIPANPDWRWGLTGDKTPWYPSMTLFRQNKLGDWGPVVDEIAARLAE